MKYFANPVSNSGTRYSRFTSDQEALMWVDETIIYARAGSGGAGSSAVKFGCGRQHAGPSGGSGGNGGSVVLVADESLNTLLSFRGLSCYRAENGENGDCGYHNGCAGKDLEIKVPTGVIVRDNSTNVLVAELIEHNQRVVIAKGGNGGRGNAAMRVKGERVVGSPAEGGQKKFLRLELKMVADIGLIGKPNAGKSSLLNAVTNANPKIADYPFTTIVPNLGMCHTRNLFAGKNIDWGSDKEAMILADIPGLLEGAHAGVGLGKGFLRHVERCDILLHVIDCSAVDPVNDFLTINNELMLFSKVLAEKSQIVVLNKIDLFHDSERLLEVMKEFQHVMSHSRILAISASKKENVDELMSRCHSFLKKIRSISQSATNISENLPNRVDSY